MKIVTFYFVILKEDLMVSTATKVGNFTFDNCLMNAAGVYCMTKEELEQNLGTIAHSGSLDFKKDNKDDSSQKQGHLRPVLVIQNLVMSMYPLVQSTQWVCQITVLNIILTMSLNCKINPIQKTIFSH